MRKKRAVVLVFSVLLFSGSVVARPNHWAQNGALDVFYATPVEQGLLSVNISHLGAGYTQQISGHNYTSIGFAPFEYLEISTALYLDGYYSDSNDYSFGPFKISPAVSFGYPFRLGSQDNILAPGLLLRGNLFPGPTWSPDTTQVPTPDPILDAIGLVSFSTELLSVHLNAGYSIELADTMQSGIPYGLAVQYTPIQMLDVALEATNTAPVSDILSIDYLTVTPLARLNLAPVGGWSFDLAIPVGIGSAVDLWRVELGASVSFDVIKPSSPPAGRIVGRVISEESGQPIRANLVFPEREIEPVTVLSETGEYSLELPPGVYRIRAEAFGYKWKEKGIVLQENEQKVVDFSLVKLDEPLAQLTGIVRDKESGEPLDGVTVSLSRSDIPDMTTDVLGIFKTILTPDSYSLTFSLTGYGDETVYVELEDGESKELNVLMSPPVSEPEAEEPVAVVEPPAEDTIPEEPEPGQDQQVEEVEKIEEPDEPEVVEEPTDEESISQPQAHADFENVRFNPGSSIISPQSYDALREVVKYLEDNPSIKLSIEGHTDSVGPADGNLLLSQQRADAVKAWLVSEGIEQDRLTAKGYGETRPIGDNRTRSGQNANRRIEFVVFSE